ncbi:MAG: RNA polymerase sigma factor [Ilumatobacteraceae bacterium]
MNAIDEAIYAKHAYELMRFATTLVGPSGAEDVVADAVLRAMTSPSWPTVTEHRAYLFRAVANEASSMRRSAGRRRARERRVASADRIEAQPIDPDVTAAMSRLSVRERSVLYLAYWLDLPVTEIAESLHLSARTTERALHTARATLEEHLR